MKRMNKTQAICGVAAVFTFSVAFRLGADLVDLAAGPPEASASVVTEAPPAFVNGSPFPQPVPWSKQDSYKPVITFCAPLDWQTRVFERGSPGDKGYTFSTQDVGDRLAGDPLSCPKPMGPVVR